MKIEAKVYELLKEDNFTANWAYEFVMDFRSGNGEILYIHRAHPGTGTHYSLKADFINGWSNFGKPLQFGELNLHGWSHSCVRYSVWVAGNNFNELISNCIAAVRNCVGTYTKQLFKELEDAQKAYALIDTI